MVSGSPASYLVRMVRSVTREVRCEGPEYTAASGCTDSCRTWGACGAPTGGEVPELVVVEAVGTAAVKVVAAIAVAAGYGGEAGLGRQGIWLGLARTGNGSCKGGSGRCVDVLGGLLLLLMLLDAMGSLASPSATMPLQPLETSACSNGAFAAEVAMHLESGRGLSGVEEREVEGPGQGFPRWGGG